MLLVPAHILMMYFSLGRSSELTFSRKNFWSSSLFPRQTCELYDRVFVGAFIGVDLLQEELLVVVTVPQTNMLAL